jgi:hypothetical protein
VRSLLGHGVEALADRIHDKTEALRGASGESDRPSEQARPEAEGRAAEGRASEAAEDASEGRESEGEPEGPEDEYGGPEPDEEQGDDERYAREPSRPRLSGAARRGPVTRSAGRGRGNLASGPSRR